MDVFFLLYLFFVLVPISTIIHETGHVIGAKLVKADHILLVLGKGDRDYTISMKRFQIIIRNVLIYSGLTQSERLKPYSRREIAFITFCGPFSNIVLFLFFLYLYSIYNSDYLLVSMLFNGWIGFVNAIPFKVKNKMSDGYIILQQLFKK